MWEIRQEVVLNTEHCIRFDQQIHTHIWRIRATVCASELDANGWVMDLYELRNQLQKLVAPYERTLLNKVPPFNKLDPTREQVAQVLAEQLGACINDGRRRVMRIEIEEKGALVAYTCKLT